MNRRIYRYDFASEVPIDEVEATPVVVLTAVESLYGEVQLQLAAPHYLDLEQRVCIVDASTQVGRDLSRLFVGLLRRGFGPDAFQVRLVEAELPTASAAA